MFSATASGMLRTTLGNRQPTAVARKRPLWSKELWDRQAFCGKHVYTVRVEIAVSRSSRLNVAASPTL
jgi:hypothetical protein